MAGLTGQVLAHEAYLAAERVAETKSEYRAGQLVAMAGATENHNLIVSNLVIALGSQLKQRNCQIYANDMRLHIPTAGLYTYPDLIVSCGESRFLDDRRDTLLNPTLIIEVLSPSTEAYDRGDKFGHYQTLKTLNEYLLVSQKDRKVERFVRKGDGFWLLSTYTDKNKTVPIESLKQELALSEIYDGVEWGD